jgi:hypothetical protein
LEPAFERLKALLITRLTPPLAGMLLGQSLRLLWANEFDIDSIHYPKRALHFLCSSLTSLMKRREERISELRHPCKILCAWERREGAPAPRPA